MAYIKQTAALFFVMGVVWLVCEYISVTSGVVLVAGMLVLMEGDMKERLDRIGKALEMHSKRIFPELWN